MPVLNSERSIYDNLIWLQQKLMDKNSPIKKIIEFIKPI